jgi:hypothetical protein
MKGLRPSPWQFIPTGRLLRRCCAVKRLIVHCFQVFKVKIHVNIERRRRASMSEDLLKRFVIVDALEIRNVSIGLRQLFLEFTELPLACSGLAWAD